jgi:DNA segregation ATPase FtsK/SpoIIIE, S-DNA-T family
MAKNSYKSKNFVKEPNKKPKVKKKWSFGLFKDRRLHLSVGLFLLVASFFLFTAFASYLFTGTSDQSVVESFKLTGIRTAGVEVENWFGLFGALAAHYFIFMWFGISAFFIPPILFLLGFAITFKKTLVSLPRAIGFSLFFILWLSTLMGYIMLEPGSPYQLSFLGGGLGYELSYWLHSILGWGTFLLLIFSLLVFVIFFFNITTILGLGSAAKDEIDRFKNTFSEEEDHLDEGVSRSDQEILEQENWQIKTIKPNQEKSTTNDIKLDLDEPLLNENSPIPNPQPVSRPNTPKSEPEFIVAENENDDKEVGEMEYYDPTLDLGSFQQPTLDLLDQHEPRNVQVTKEELEQNKDKILETLINFKIGIASIKATIGPTVTLYEIVPDAGVKISRIKNLEDDIALSLAALGIRIIAPIPGKGTIGIEVPNKNREVVSIRSVLGTEKFAKSTHELPVILGKTISNEVYVTDLAKMPHLLMAGATGQGKSVGINVLLASLIYKKHPSQLKFVLVDPKKVELTLYNKIERHYLAMLPNNEEAIITDTKKVIYTLNSLCIEMDNRLSLFKDAACRNLKEYNAKFIRRRLNPEKGHRYMPYIVLIIDELADLMVTAGKEVETPISRLAAVARAIGIHLVLATQRPSVNVITGVIKANFPARLSFRVTSKIDSRTILDMGGAEQLVGMGDMLFSLGSETVRLQCPYIDTDEVEKICDFVGAQRGYETAYQLPEFEGDDEGGSSAEVDLNDRDAMFDEAARLIVRHQQGSTSLIQRKLKLGYNRAGRLIDQLEAAGIVGAFEGSKAREVLVQDEYTLEQLLSVLNEKKSG